MTQDEKHSIALMRYAAITPLVNGTLDGYQSKSSFYREAALKSYPADDGSMRQFSPASIQRWYRSYLKSGFDGLMPKGRTDSGKSRVLDDASYKYSWHINSCCCHQKTWHIFITVWHHNKRIKLMSQSHTLC